MTKIGEGTSPQEPSIEKYREELDQNTLKFRNALECYATSQGEEKTHFKTVMDQSLGLIQSAVREIKKTGMQKQELKVEKDYAAYMKDESLQNREILEQDLNTLRAYNNRS